MALSKEKSIVVTGAVGFIGSCFVRFLNDQGYTNLILCDRLGKDERWKNLVGKQFLEIVSPEDLFETLEERASEISAIVHLGACSSTVETDADFLLENNTHFSEAVAFFAIEQGIRFIYASSAATYGDGKFGFSDDPEKLLSLQPLNMYGYSKHLFDLALYREKLLDHVVGLKFFNVFGPNEWHKGRMASTVLHFTKQIRDTGRVKLFKSSEPNRFEDGGQMRDFIFVKDVVSILFELLSNKVTGIYNLGTGSPETWNSLAKNVFTALSLPPQIDYIDMPADLVGKYQNYTAADMTRLKKAMPGLHFTRFNEAICDTVVNYLVPGVYF